MRVIQITIQQDSTPFQERELDPNWRYVDAAGHEHRWAGHELPTLKRVEVPDEKCPRCDALLEVGGSYMACRDCGERIIPGMRYIQQHVAGRCFCEVEVETEHPLSEGTIISAFEREFDGRTFRFPDCRVVSADDREQSTNRVPFVQTYRSTLLALGEVEHVETFAMKPEVGVE